MSRSGIQAEIRRREQAAYERDIAIYAAIVGWSAFAALLVAVIGGAA